ncbi:MAG: endolytic transglycosylase MltG, partial [Gammaproteobacteria bacterium]|nr:endolytic transglycosylase MltG [Gammaproteobacteria bacterium]
RDAVAAQDKLTHTLTGLADAEVMVKLGYPERHPEGRFLPDTYAFPKGTTDVDFLRRAYASMHEYLQRAWPERDTNLPLASMNDALTLASIVEKETGAPHERPLIAGVFVRRLQKGMRLQTDPTVIYGLGDRYDGNIRRRDLEAETPYNTYRIKGLPPTPIALPGKDAINAALHPEGGDALYFVARGDGTHEFSSSIEQHNRAVMKYQIKPALAATQKRK